MGSSDTDFRKSGSVSYVVGQMLYCTWMEE